MCTNMYFLVHYKITDSDSDSVFAPYLYYGIYCFLHIRKSFNFATHMAPSNFLSLLHFGVSLCLFLPQVQLAVVNYLLYIVVWVGTKITFWPSKSPGKFIGPQALVYKMFWLKIQRDIYYDIYHILIGSQST